MKTFLFIVFVFASINCRAQNKRPYLGWTESHLKMYLSNNKNVVYDDTWKSSDDKIECISFHKTSDPTVTVLFYFNLDTGLCFEHSVFMPIDQLPAQIKSFNAMYKKVEDGLWTNESKDTNIRLEYKIGDSSFRVNYTNYLDDL